MADPWNWSAAAGGVPLRLEQAVGLLRLEGPDTLRFLHGQSSQDLALARPGAWRRTCFITPTARLLALAEVLVEEDGAWLVITAGDAAAVRQALDRVLFPADAVRLGPLQAGLWMEPLGPAPLPPAPSDDPREAPPWRRAPGGGWWLAEALVLPLDGATADRPPGAAALPTPLANAAPLPESLREWRRLAMGIPAAPGEISGDSNPFELGLAGRVSLSKGCYVGQETLARLATYDGVKQQLRRWHLADPGGNGAPAVGQALRTAQGERAGVVTSRLALAAGGWIGLALVRRGALDQEELVAEGEGPTRWGPLRLSLPDGFAPPPVGAGGGAGTSPGG